MALGWQVIADCRTHHEYANFIITVSEIERRSAPLTMVCDKHISQ